MRDIRFRGQIIRQLENGGSWIYWGIEGTDMLDAIDSETIGEYIGLEDPNRVDIFEGDVMQGDPDEQGRWLTAFDVDRDKNGWSVEPQDIEDGCYVIGNIHESPSLLEGK